MIVLLGGKTYLLGPAVGAVLYFFISEFTGLPPVWNQIGFGVVLIVMILTAPNGVLSIIQNLFSGRYFRNRDKQPDNEGQAAMRDLPNKA